MKSMQEKESIMGVRGQTEKSASLVMPDNNPRDGFFYLSLTPMIDFYILAHQDKRILPR